MSDDLGLATERTHLAWRRTALTYLVAGLFTVRLVEDPALGVVVGILAVGAAGIAGSVAVTAHRHRRAPIGALAAVTATISVVAALGAAVR